MTENPLVSLIVITYNSAAHLPAFFDALAITRYDNYDVIVVDNASPDGTASMVSANYPSAHLLANRENVGFGRACNQGAQAARGDLLVFLNPDVLVTPDWLRILVRHMAEQPSAGIICPQTLYPDEIRTKNQEPRTKSDDATSDSQFSVLGSSRGTAETAAVPGAALMIRRAAWKQLGGFDETYFLYWEDTDLCWRAWLRGWRVLEDLDAYVLHERGGSSGERWDAERTKNALRTHLKTMRWRVVSPFLAVTLAKSLIKSALGRAPGILGAWLWNARHLGDTLARRREILRDRQIDPARFEQLATIHSRRGQQERRARRQMVYYSNGKN